MLVMTEHVQERISELHGVPAVEVPELRQPACTFFAAGKLQFARLGDELLDRNTEDAALRILKSCPGASALWQAEVITRFHPDVSGTVLFEDRNAGVISTLERFQNPAIVDGVLRFFVADAASLEVSFVKAILGDTLRVVVMRVEPEPR